MAIQTECLLDAFYTKCIITGLKEAIHAHVWIQPLDTWQHACEGTFEVDIVINAQPTHSSIITHAHLATNTQPT